LKRLATAKGAYSIGDVKASDARVPASFVERHAVPLVVGLLAIAALAAYHNTFLAPFVLDDADSITENATIHHLWPLWGALSPPPGGATVSGRPILNLSLAVNYAISGERVWSYHALSLLIHFLAACALFGVVRRTLEQPVLRERFGKAQLPLAAAVAAIWLLHPLQTESVTYVSQRAEALAGLFYLLTLYCFIRATDGAVTTRPAAWLATSWAACLLGMATKEDMASAPVLVLLYEITFLADEAGGGLAVAWRRRRGYYLALASTWILLGCLVVGNQGRGGTSGFQAGLTPLIYLQSQFHAVCVYLKLCLWPHPLVFDYGQVAVRDFAAVWPQAVVTACLVVGTAVAVWRRSPVGFVGVWFFSILAPSSSIVPMTSQTMAEHRMYLSLAAVVAFVVIGLFALLGRRSLLLWPSLAVVLGCLTFARNETYGSELALWKDTVAKEPRNARARYNLGVVYSQNGRYDLAVEQDKAALQSGDSWAAAEQAPTIQNKLGYDLAQLGRLPEAVADYEQALRLRPEYAVAHFNLARALVGLGRYPEAVDHYEDAVRLNFGGADVESELGEALIHGGRDGEAIPHYREALRLDPGSAPVANNLAYALLLSGRTDESIAAYREAVRLSPQHAAAWVGLGYSLVRANRPAEAIPACAEAVRLQPGLADAHNTLGIALARSGRQAEAIASFEDALRIDAGKADVQNNLGNALAATGRSSDAIACYREALRLDPNYAPAHRNLGEELRRAGFEAEAAEQLDAAARLDTAAGR
jgi:protein O-mannosyl-transferase